MDNEYNEFFFCRICGLKQDDPPWGDDGKNPTRDICPCCGVEFGYEDCILPAIMTHREEWLKKGAIWWLPKLKPSDWSLEDQLKNIPHRFK